MVLKTNCLLGWGGGKEGRRRRHWGGGACMYPTKQIDRDDRKRPGGFEPLETVGCEHIGKQTL